MAKKKQKKRASALDIATPEQLKMALRRKTKELQQLTEANAALSRQVSITYEQHQKACERRQNDPNLMGLMIRDYILAMDRMGVGVDIAAPFVTFRRDGAEIKAHFREVLQNGMHTYIKMLTTIPGKGMPVVKHTYEGKPFDPDEEIAKWEDGLEGTHVMAVVEFHPGK